MENLALDENGRNALGAVTNDVFQLIKNARVNPVTGRMLVDLSVTSSNTSIGSTIPGGTAGSVLFLGIGSTLAQDNAHFFYDDSNNYLGLGTNTPSATLDVLGSFKYVDGNQAASYVLISDTSGNAQWNDLSHNTTFIDNLIANGYFTTNLANNNNFVTNLANNSTFISTLLANSTFITNIGGLVSVVTDATLTGDGTAGNPLHVVGGGSGLTLETNGVANGDQTLLNLKQGTNVTITDDGVGGITIDATGTGTPLTLETDGVANGDQTLLNLVAGSNITLTDNGTGSVTIDATTTTLQTNGTPNGDQTLLDLISGANITLTDNGTGGVTIEASKGVSSFLRIASPTTTMATILISSAIGCDMSVLEPDYLWLAVAYQGGGTDIAIYRLEKQNIGNYIYKGVKTTITSLSVGDIHGIAEVGGIVYIKYESVVGGGVATCLVSSFDTALNSLGLITGFPSGSNLSGFVGDTDGVHIWSANSVFPASTTNLNTFNAYTISGGVATQTSTVVFAGNPMSGNGDQILAVNNGTNFYILHQNDVVPQTVFPFDSSGAALTTFDTALFSYINGYESGINWIKFNGSYAYVSVQKSSVNNTNWYLQVQSIDIP